MKRIVRGIVTGSLIGAAVGLAMLLKNRQMLGGMKAIDTGKMKHQTRGAVRMVKNSTHKWTSALKDGKEAIAQRFARRTQ